MTSPQDRFEVNEQEGAAQVIDGETILINFTNGLYFSMDETGTVIWELLAHGHSVEQIVRAMSERYEVDADRARADVERIVAELREANLIVPTDRPPPDLESEQADGDATRPPYAEPHLNAYGDMSELLLLDPPMPGILDDSFTDPKSPPPAGD